MVEATDFEDKESQWACCELVGGLPSSSGDAEDGAADVGDGLDLNLKVGLLLVGRRTAETGDSGMGAEKNSAVEDCSPTVDLVDTIDTQQSSARKILIPQRRGNIFSGERRPEISYTKTGVCVL